MVNRQENLILLVDDDDGLLRLLTMRMEAQGYRVITANSAEEAATLIEIKRPDVVISDLKMTGKSGMDLFRSNKNSFPFMPFIIMTAHGTIPDAVEATQEGVFSFIPKPIDKDRLFDQVDKALKISGERNNDPILNEGDIVTRNPFMRQIIDQALKIASSNVSVLINGDSGTGKELLAQLIHNKSAYREGPFIPVNCSAIPEHLLESELFGFEKGAFTSANKSHKGLFQAAHKGTLFLDEIGDMPLSLQAKLLRVLQEKSLRPLGSTKMIDVDVRLIYATNIDLKKAVEEKRFRDDLYYRIKVMNLKLPPLEQRREDIPILANHFLDKLIGKYQSPTRNFSPDALQTLMFAAWPGNVRQLYNVVEQLVVLAHSPLISKQAIEQVIDNHYDDSMPSLAEAKSEFERNYLIRLLQLANGNVSQAALAADRNRTDFYKLLSKHHIKPSDFKEDDSYSSH